jgi:hypothetical protein
MALLSFALALSGPSWKTTRIWIYLLVGRVHCPLRTDCARGPLLEAPNARFLPSKALGRDPLLIFGRRKRVYVIQGCYLVVRSACYFDHYSLLGLITIGPLVLTDRFIYLARFAG